MDNPKQRTEKFMRRNFATILKEAKVNIQDEYARLYAIFYDKYLYENGNNFSFYDLIEASFSGFWFRGTCVSLADFNETHEFSFEKEPQDFNLDYLISFCEYVYNLTMGFMGCNNTYASFFNTQRIIEQIFRIIEKIGYMQSSEDGLTIFVEKNQAAISVSEIVPQEISYKVISYNHHSMNGDIEGKKAILLILANQLEPQEKKLNQIDATFKSELFFAFNNFNIRHNNIDPSDKRYYNKAVAEMSEEELEHWYDETYQMCLLAFLRIEHIERKKAINELKKKVEAKDGNT